MNAFSFVYPFLNNLLIYLFYAKSALITRSIQYCNSEAGTVGDIDNDANNSFEYMNGRCSIDKYSGIDRLKTMDPWLAYVRCNIHTN